MRIIYMTEVNYFEDFPVARGHRLYIVEVDFLFSIKLFEVVFGVVCSSSDLNPCHARKGHASLAGATIGTQNSDARFEYHIENFG